MFPWLGFLELDFASYHHSSKITREMQFEHDSRPPKPWTPESENCLSLWAEVHERMVALLHRKRRRPCDGCMYEYFLVGGLFLFFFRFCPLWVDLLQIRKVELGGTFKFWERVVPGIRRRWQMLRTYVWGEWKIEDWNCQKTGSACDYTIFLWDSFTRSANLLWASSTIQYRKETSNLSCSHLEKI